jgi:hypothetical protein
MPNVARRKSEIERSAGELAHEPNARLYWKDGRAYIDARAWAAWGGKLEALVPTNERGATKDPVQAAIHFAHRLSHLRELRIRHPNGLPVAEEEACPDCGAEMRILAFLTDSFTTAGILRHLGLPATSFRRGAPPPKQRGGHQPNAAGDSLAGRQGEGFIVGCVPEVADAQRVGARGDRANLIEPFPSAAVVRITSVPGSRAMLAPSSGAPVTALVTIPGWRSAGR